MSVALPVGVTKANSGIVLSTAVVSYAALLRRNLDKSIPIVITSGTRTDTSQAKVMLDRYNQYGSKPLYDVYEDSLINELLATPKDVASWTAVVTRAYGDGRLSRVGHTTGMAMDVRTRDLQPTQIAALKAAVLATGGKWLLESDPPHAHITVPLSLKNITGVSAADWGTWLAVGLAGAAGVWFMVKKLL